MKQTSRLTTIKIVDGSPASPFWVSWFETPTLYAYYMAGLFTIGGVNFCTLKAASLLPAILTVAAVYPVGLVLFGQRVALLSALRLAVSRWHMTMSRWGFNELMPPLFQLAATAWLVHGFVTRRALHFVLAGLTLGLGMYTYLDPRLVVATIVAYILYRVVFERGFLRTYSLGLLLFGLNYLLCFGPLMVTYAQNTSTLLNRSRQVSILKDVESVGSWSPIVENTKRHVLMFHGQGDSNPRHNISGHPMLSFVPGVLMILGAGLALRRIADHRFALLLWIFIALLGGILTNIREGAAGVSGARSGASGVRARRGCRRCVAAPYGVCPNTPRSAVAVLATALGYTAYANYRAYFITHAGSEKTWASFSPGENAVAQRLVAEREAAGSISHVYISPRFYYFSPVRFLTYRPVEDDRGGLNDPEYRIIEPHTDLPLAADSSRDLLLLLETDVAQSLTYLHDYYPHSTTTFVSESRMPLYGEVIIPRADLQAIRGLDVEVDGKRQLTGDSDGSKPLDAALLTLRPGETLVGALKAGRSGQYDFETTGPIIMELDGAPVTSSHFLGQGLHDLVLQEHTVGEDPVSSCVRLMEGWNHSRNRFCFACQPPATACWDAITPRWIGLARCCSSV